MEIKIPWAGFRGFVSACYLQVELPKCREFKLACRDGISASGRLTQVLNWASPSWWKTIFYRRFWTLFYHHMLSVSSFAGFKGCISVKWCSFLFYLFFFLSLPTLLVIICTLLIIYQKSHCVNILRKSLKSPLSWFWGYLVLFYFVSFFLHVGSLCLLLSSVCSIMCLCGSWICCPFLFGLFLSVVFIFLFSLLDSAQSALLLLSFDFWTSALCLQRCTVKFWPINCNPKRKIFIDWCFCLYFLFFPKLTK